MFRTLLEGQLHYCSIHLSIHWGLTYTAECGTNTVLLSTLWDSVSSLHLVLFLFLWWLAVCLSFWEFVGHFYRNNKCKSSFVCDFHLVIPLGAPWPVFLLSWCDVTLMHCQKNPGSKTQHVLKRETWKRLQSQLNQTVIWALVVFNWTLSKNKAEQPTWNWAKRKR